MSSRGPVELLVVEQRKDLTSAERSRIATEIIQEASKRLVEQQPILLVVTDSPVGTLSIVRKHWHVLRRKLERERASTFDTSKRGPLERQLEVMETLPFAVGCPGDANCGVFFIESHQLGEALRRE